MWANHQKAPPPRCPAPFGGKGRIADDDDRWLQAAYRERGAEGDAAQARGVPRGPRRHEGGRENLDSEIRDHKRKVVSFAFYARHLAPDAVYVLSASDVSTYELIVDPP